MMLFVVDNLINNERNLLVERKTAENTLNERFTHTFKLLLVKKCEIFKGNLRSLQRRFKSKLLSF